MDPKTFHMQVFATISLMLLVLTTACATNQTEQIKTAVAATVAALQTQTATVPATPTPTETSTPTPTMGESLYSEADLAVLEAAFDSGAYEQVRALFTEDGVMTNVGGMYEAVQSNSIDGNRYRVDGAEFRHMATQHHPSDLIILGEPIQVGEDSIAFAWTWSYGPSGTALLSLRDGRIAFLILNPSHSEIPLQAPATPAPTARP